MKTAALVIFIFFGLTSLASAESRDFYKSLDRLEKRAYKIYKKPTSIKGRQAVSRFYRAPRKAAHGKLWIEHGEKIKGCSGTVIPQPRNYRWRKQKPVLVATAAHCLSRDGQRPTRITFVPGYNQAGYKPNKPEPFYYGVHEVSGYRISSYYNFDSPDASAKNMAFDFAFLELKNPRRLARSVGYMGISFNAPIQRPYTSFGYPSESLSNGMLDYVNDGERMTACSSYLSAYQQKRLYYSHVGPKSPSMNLMMDCRLGGGASGGAVTIGRSRGRRLVGVNSAMTSGDVAISPYQIAARYSAVAKALWKNDYLGWKLARPILYGV